MSDDTPHDETPLDTLPLDSWHRAQGARMVPFAGYEMPIQYTGPSGGIVAEHNWTRESASLFDVSHMGQLTLKGDHAAHELEKLLPGAISNLKPGKMRYSLLLTEAGGVIDDLMVTNTGPHLALVVNGACKWDDIAHLREHLPDDITLTHFDDFALLALQGPKAGEVLESIIPGTGELTFMTAGLFEWDGAHLWVSRAGYTGEDGFEISVHEGRAEDLANALVADERVKPAGLGARDSLRLEAGLPLYGHDLDQNIDPVSADLSFALSKKRRSEGGFFGHKAIAARLAEAEGGTLAKKRVGLLLDGRMPAREGADVFAGDQKIGTVTSGGFSPTLGRPVAMGYVDALHAADGTALECEVRGKRLPATVSPMPFVPHRYFRGS
ncbi:glycine cleavage system aminomethyltransferase GcvT [Erythrobacter ani]|uniref:aminomethyltransferase n=1 Tax=Erythrobacter ani TaxID=2827235 RepID=A0ABS6SM39_9SPHN|nr:glycine cleavage system aminomethyltransferase GcvT [Erythrobacter ani]MBV7266096.1 glycine cleavage system aminomethyltransferase GcvT [Erythrobacter ani]